MQNVVIYYPNGTNSYFEIGAKLIDENKNETTVLIEKIEEENGKVRVYFSNNTEILYSLPWSSKIIN